MSTQPRRSPPTARVVALLDFFGTAPPTARYGLSDLARRLEVNKATCLAILNELVFSGYLTRTPEKTYALGPALISLGRRAQRGFALADVARREMDTLHDQFGFACDASTIVGEQILVLEHVGPREASVATGRAGQTYPLAPPFGLTSMAWEDDDQIRAWLRRSPALPGSLDEARVWATIRSARRHGFLIERPSEAGLRLSSLLASLDVGELPEDVRSALGEVVSPLGYRDLRAFAPRGDRQYDVSMMAAPAYDPDGRPNPLISLWGIRKKWSGRDLRQCLDALLSATREITAAVGGYDPWSGAAASKTLRQRSNVAR